MPYPFKLSAKSEALPLAVIVLAWAMSAFFYSSFPERVPSHWNFAGDVDGWSSAAMGAFTLPAVITLMYLMFLAFPLLDPKKERYAEFSKPYNVLKSSILVVLASIYLLAGFAGMGVGVRMELATPVLIGVLFMIIGNYLGKVKSNWLMGVRTPWTLSDEGVWNKTNRLAGKLFVLAGAVMALQGLLPDAIRVPVFVATIAAVTVVPIAYSYAVYRKGAGKA